MIDNISNLTIPELLEDYRKKETIVLNVIDKSNSLDEFGIMKDYLEEKQLFTRIGNAIDFSVAGTAFIQEDKSNTSLSLMSLDEKTELVNRLLTLTGNQNPDFVHTIYTQRFRNDTPVMSQQDRYDVAKTQIWTILNYSNATEANNKALSSLTVGQLEQALYQTERLMQNYGIDPKDLNCDINEPIRDILIKEANRDNLFVIEENCVTTETLLKENVSIAQEQVQSLVIVESIDGYVLATNMTPELAKQNPAAALLYDELVHNGNEIVDIIPEHTTSDPAKVGGNTALEEVDDIGTIEKQQGVHHFETREQITENFKATKITTENRTNETSTHKVKSNKTTIER